MQRVRKFQAGLAEWSTLWPNATRAISRSNLQKPKTSAWQGSKHSPWALQMYRTDKWHSRVVRRQGRQHRHE
jgi:hypothetical protein